MAIENLNCFFFDTSHEGTKKEKMREREREFFSSNYGSEFESEGEIEM